MKNKLLVLTDLWGKERFEWFKEYQNALNVTTVVYDSCELGLIDKSAYNEESLHQQFVKGGIEIAVKQLIEKEKEAVNILAFSIGGTIAWKASLQGLKVKNLFAVSATRLRHETEKPNCKAHLIYGSEDAFKPKEQWFEQLGIIQKEIKNKGHEVYKEATLFKDLVSMINNNRC